MQCESKLSSSCFLSLLCASVLGPFFLWPSSSPTSPWAPSHELECVQELKQIADLLDSLNWWRWLSKVLLILLVCALITITVSVCVTLETFHLCLKRKFYTERQKAEIEQLRRRAQQLRLGDHGVARRGASLGEVSRLPAVA